MKTTEFLKEYDTQEYNDEVGMAKNNLHTIVRVSTHLGRAFKEDENLPEWCQEKIAQAKGMMVAVMDYIISQHEMGQQPEVPTFNAESAYKKYEEIINEEASAGASCAGAFATVMSELGGSTKEIVKRQQTYSNQRTAGGAVKVKKAK
jgi:hypothetical protein